MEQSVTYQAIIEKGVERGEISEARAMLLKLGSQCFGEPSVRVRAAIKKIGSKEPLEELILHTRSATSWTELMKQ